MVGDVQDVIAMALGGEPVTTTVEGRERYTVSIRYPRDLRSDPQAIATQVLIPLPSGGTVPLGEVAKVELAQGPSSIRTENAQLAAYIYVDLRDRDIGGYVADAQKAVAAQVKFPPGYYVTWSGQFEYLERAKARLQDRRAGHAAHHLPAALSQLPAHHRDPDRHAVGAVRAGRRPLADVVARLQPVGRRRRRLHRARRRRRRDRRGDADLSRPCADRAASRSAPREGRAFTRDDLYAAIMAGAVERVRPKMMTVAAIMAGLLPIMWSHGTGAEVMQRIAVPMIGGMVSSTVLTLVVIPAIYALVKGFTIRTSQLAPVFDRP